MVVDSAVDMLGLMELTLFSLPIQSWTSRTGIMLLLFARGESHVNFRNLKMLLAYLATSSMVLVAVGLVSSS